MLTYNDVISVKLPNRTASYEPVSNEQICSLLKDQIKIFLPEFKIIQENFWLSNDNQKMLAKFNLESDTIKEDAPLCVVIKNSYDKSTATAIGTGVGLENNRIWMRNSDITLFRKHTKYVLSSLSANMASALEDASSKYKELILLKKIIKEVPCGDAHAFALFGIARGYGMIGVRAMSDAYKNWNSSDSKTLWEVANSILSYVETNGDPSSMMEDAGALGSVIEILPEIFNIKKEEVNNERKR